MSVRNQVSVLGYAKSLLEDSLITGVPQIIQTPSLSRRILKSVVLACCLIGFIYQTTLFMKIFWNYPTVLDIEVEYPESIPSPAITFCNLNGIRRKTFCDRNPSNCDFPVDRIKFCEFFPRVCELSKNEHLQFPVEDALRFEQIDNKWLKELGHSNTSTLPYCRKILKSTGENEPCGVPKIRMQMNTGDDGYRNCYTLFSTLHSDTPNILPVPKRKEALFHLVFDPEEEEYFRPDREVGVIVAIHSPHTFLNPFYDGFIVRPGYLHSVHLKVVEEKLLPFPYETKCQDYKHMREENGGVGPLSQEMCVSECILKASLRDCNCTLPHILLPHNHPICNPDVLAKTNCFKFNISECYSACQQSCEFTDFDYDVKERKLQKFTVDTVEELYNAHDETLKKGVLAIFLKRPEKIVYSHRPQYEDIEVFSFMGGYMGIWLGMSFIAVFDFIEAVCYFFCFWTRRTLVPTKA